MELVSVILSGAAILFTVGMAMFRSPKEQVSEIQREVDAQRTRIDTLSNLFYQTHGKHDNAIENLDRKIGGLTNAVEKLTDRINDFLTRNGHGGRA